MTLDQGDIGRIDALVNGLLERDYQDAAGSVLRAIGSSTRSGRVADGLDALDVEVARLAEAGEQLTPQNAVLRTLLVDLADDMEANASLLRNIAGRVQGTGVNAASTLTRQLALPGIDDAVLARLGIAWNVPDPRAVNALVGYVDSAAWADELAKYGPRTVEIINNQAIIGVVQGRGPLATAERIRLMLQGGDGVMSLPSAQADVMMRTLQIQSYQTASAANQLVNPRVIVGQIRIESLGDDRICLACIALHGTRMLPGQKVIDHHNGRGTSIPITQFNGLERERAVQTGPEWFAGLPEDRRRRIAGPSKFNAMQAGRVSLADFVQPYSDPVFGEMVRESSLVDVLGDEAEAFKSG